MRLSWTVNVLSLDDLGTVIEDGRKRDYANFNIKIGGGNPKFDVELARQVRRLAPDSFLWADGNCGFGIATALEVAPQLAEVGVDVLESPLPPNRISGDLARLPTGPGLGWTWMKPKSRRFWI